MTEAIRAALAYAARGWPVFPVRNNPDPAARKVPHTSHGKDDATTDRAVIVDWWRRWPSAVASIVTGEPSGVIGLDIDIRVLGAADRVRTESGFDGLDELGISMLVETPLAHTPRGGCAQLFRWPGHFVKTVSGKLAPHVDIRGDGGSLILPPGPGRYWDPHLGPDTPIAAMPAWMVVEDATPEPLPPKLPLRRQRLTRYAEASLDNAVAQILNAPAGQQRDTLNREVYSIARLARDGVIPVALAFEALLLAALGMRSYDPHRPWRPIEINKLVRAAFTDGLARARRAERRRA